MLSRVTPRTSPPEEEQLAELRAKLFAARAHARPPRHRRQGARRHGTASRSPACAPHGARPATCRRSRSRCASATSCATRWSTAIAIARVFHEGKTKDLDGTLDDYAFCAQGFLISPRPPATARGGTSRTRLLATRARALRRRRGRRRRLLLAPAGDPLLVHRPESHHDSAIPSGAAIATQALLRLGLVGGDAARPRARREVPRAAPDRRPPAPTRGRPPRCSPRSTSTCTKRSSSSPTAKAATRSSRPRAAPTRRRSRRGPWAQPSILEAKVSAGPRARAFVCKGPTCSPPVTEVAELIELLTAP